MPPNVRGRIPGSVGARPATAGGVLPRGARSPGPVREVSGPLLADAGGPGGGTATDAVAPGPEVELVEPEPCSRDVASMHEFNLVLIAGDNPRPEEVLQGNLNVCPLAATLVAMAATRASDLVGMISEQPARITSRCVHPRHCCPHHSDRLITVGFPGGRTVRVSSLLWMTGGHVAYCHSESHSGWMSYIEKAYAMWRCHRSYNVLDGVGTGTGDSLTGYEPPDTREVFADLAGSWVMAEFGTNRMYSAAGDSALTTSGWQQMLRNAQHAPTIAPASPDAAENSGVERNHSYAVMRVQRHSVSLRNPRGGEHAEIEVRLADFRALFQAVIQTA